MPRRNPDVYRATLTQLKLDAFGIAQTIDYTGEVEIYQARVSPELWRARPMFKHGSHNWEASSAEALMKLITSDFAGVVRPWRLYARDGTTIMRPSLLPRDKSGERQTGS